ncbi:MAG: hypothetical protein ACTHMY_17845 [Solirubrobacteraceae bacterium]
MKRTQVLSKRVRVRLHRDLLDHQLADGLDPLELADRAMRAGQLAAMPARRRTARSLRGVIEAAGQRPGLPFSPAIPVSRGAVLAWRQGLLGLAERLERPEPVNPCGVARALVVLTDGAGPLYDRGAAGSMGDAVWWIADGLQL